MIIEQSFSVNASRERTAQFFLDIDRVTSCIPGVENVREVEPGKYQAVLAVRLGPIRAAFQGAMSLDDSEAPARLKASGEGRDRATGSVAKVSFTADLTEDEPGRTEVHAVADVALRGRMAQFGTGVMRAAAGELVQEFASCANATLAEPEVPAAAVPETETDARPAQQPSAPPRPAAAPPPRSIVAILLTSLLKATRKRLWNLVARVRGGKRSATNRGQR